MGVSLHRWRENNISVSDTPMITLKIERPGKFFVAVERTAGDSGDFLIRDNLLAVLDHGDVSTD
jgi:hypothetical protein